MTVFAIYLAVRFAATIGLAVFGIGMFALGWVSRGENDRARARAAR